MTMLAMSIARMIMITRITITPMTMTTRTAMIMAGPLMSLLMLNNNLHIAHHAEPHVSWYEVPKLSRRVNAVERAREAGLLYEGGYAEVFRKFSFKPMGAPVREGA